MPHSIAAKITKSLDPQNNDYTLPVLPGVLAKDIPFKINRYTKERIFYSRSLPTKDEIRQNNQQTFEDAAALLENGFAVNIFPAGHIDIDIHEQWPKGTGEIISRVSDEIRRQLIIVPYRFEDDYNREKLAASLVAKSIGKTPKARTFTLTIGDQITALELTGNNRDARSVSNILQQYYLSSLKPPKRNQR